MWPSTANQLAFPLPPLPDRQGLSRRAGPAGRFREFYQADIDVIGDGKLDISNDAEIPAIIYIAPLPPWA